jgi:hypothetical protein
MTKKIHQVENLFQGTAPRKSVRDNDWGCYFWFKFEEKIRRTFLKLKNRLELPTISRAWGLGAPAPPRCEPCFSDLQDPFFLYKLHKVRPLVK